MSIRTLVGAAIWSTAAHLLGRGSLVIGAILLARNLDTGAFAAYSYFQLTVSMLATYAAMGLGMTASRFFAECNHVDDSEMPPIGGLWILSIFIGLTFALAILLIPAHLMNGGLGVPRWMLALGVFVVALDVVPGGGILGLERYPEAAVTAGAYGIVLILGTIMASKSGSGVAAMMAFVFASLIQSIGNAIVVVREVGLRKLARNVNMNTLFFRRIFGFAGPMFGVTLLAASGSWVVGRMILAGSTNEHGFALYTIGLQWYALALFVPGMVSRILFPRLVRAHLQEGEDNSRILVRKGSIAALLAVTIISILGFLLSPWLLSLYGGNYGVDKWLLGAFLLAAIPHAPVNTIGNAILATHGQKTWFLATAFWFILIVAAAANIYDHGAWGGAASLGLSSLGLATLAFSIAKKRKLI
ncbi:oligosaccharide flippase family protein [Brachymonas denitrificans]|uniref:oligosaccharide flippase family protein n=1 Tax=Brachymonas denitrificans TaxID=28220 RepID=UPI002AFE0C32|nr:oligosaccharide flippase family protein [Brachymonas denitrificans]